MEVWILKPDILKKQNTLTTGQLLGYLEITKEDVIKLDLTPEWRPKDYEEAHAKCLEEGYGCHSFGEDDCEVPCYDNGFEQGYSQCLRDIIKELEEK